jgi:hypothetical protein
MNQSDDQFQPTNSQDNHGVKVELPNATATLVLGILSIVFCFCYGIIGLILGIVALAISSGSMELYHENPHHFTVASYNNLKAGRICSIIGVSISALFILIIAAVIIFDLVDQGYIYYP